jgi:hypothetical protein
MSKKSRKAWTKAKIIGRAVNPFGSAPALLFKDAGDPDDGNVNIAVPAEPGVPVPFGATIGDFRQGAGEDDLEYKTTATVGKKAPRGPIQVSTEKFRSGWENTFGKRGVN